MPFSGPSISQHVFLDGTKITFIQDLFLQTDLASLTNTWLDELGGVGWIDTWLNELVCPTIGFQGSGCCVKASGVRKWKLHLSIVIPSS